MGGMSLKIQIYMRNICRHLYEESWPSLSIFSENQTNAQPGLHTQREIRTRNPICVRVSSK